MLEKLEGQLVHPASKHLLNLSRDGLKLPIRDPPEGNHKRNTSDVRESSGNDKGTQRETQSCFRRQEGDKTVEQSIQTGSNTWVSKQRLQHRIHPCMRRTFCPKFEAQKNWCVLFFGMIVPLFQQDLGSRKKIKDGMRLVLVCD